MASGESGKPGRPPAADWERHRDEIRRFYINEGRPLSEVRRLMRGKYNFEASDRSYKAKFNEWGIRKYKNNEEMSSMVMPLELGKAEDGNNNEVERDLWANGQPVDLLKLKRYLRRQGESYITGLTEPSTDFEVFSDLPDRSYQTTTSPSPSLPDSSIRETASQKLDSQSTGQRLAHKRGSVDSGFASERLPYSRKTGQYLPDDSDETCKRRRTLQPESRKFACPFYKHRPDIYGGRNGNHNNTSTKYRVCAGPGFDTVARIKEHLYRRHMAPIRCLRCRTILPTETDLQDHLRSKVSCVLQSPTNYEEEGVTQRQLDMLKNKRKDMVSGSGEDRWISVYRILFPGDPIPSPYYELEDQNVLKPTSHDSQFSELATFNEYSQLHLPQIVEERLLQGYARELRKALQTNIHDIVRESLQELFHDWEAQRRNQGSENSWRTPDSGFRTEKRLPGTSHILNEEALTHRRIENRTDISGATSPSASDDHYMRINPSASTNDTSSNLALDQDPELFPESFIDIFHDEDTNFDSILYPAEVWPQQFHQEPSPESENRQFTLLEYNRRVSSLPLLAPGDLPRRTPDPSLKQSSPTQRGGYTIMEMLNDETPHPTGFRGPRLMAG